MYCEIQFDALLYLEESDNADNERRTGGSLPQIAAATRPPGYRPVKTGSSSLAMAQAILRDNGKNSIHWMGPQNPEPFVWLVLIWQVWEICSVYFKDTC